MFWRNLNSREEEWEKEEAPSRLKRKYISLIFRGPEKNGFRIAKTRKKTQRFQKKRPKTEIGGIGAQLAVSGEGTMKAKSEIQKGSRIEKEIERGRERKRRRAGNWGRKEIRAQEVAGSVF